MNRRVRLDLNYSWGRSLRCLGVPPPLGSTVVLQGELFVVTLLKYDADADACTVELFSGVEPLCNQIFRLSDVIGLPYLESD